MKKKYLSILQNSMTVLLFLTMSIVCCTWLIRDYGLYKKEISDLRKTFFSNQKNILAEQVDLVIDYINFQKGLEQMRLKRELKSRVNQLIRTVAYFFNEYKSTKTEPEIEKLIRDVIYSSTWMEKRGYYFVFNSAGQLIIHGRDRKVTEDSENGAKKLQIQLIFSEVKEVIDKDGEGYVTYLWNKDTNSEEYSPKLTYVKLYKPLNWIIAAGEYLDEVGLVFQNQIKEHLSKQRFNNGQGQIFISDYKGKIIVYGDD